jgi:hypothetical protein
MTPKTQLHRSGWILAPYLRLIAMICLTAVGLACGSGDGSHSNASDTSDSFALESVELGIGFDEPVAVASTSESAELVDIAEVTLESVGDRSSFAGTLHVVDNAGNATELRLEVNVGEDVL